MRRCDEREINKWDDDRKKGRKHRNNIETGREKINRLGRCKKA